jgi:hypothetical protein
MGRALERDEILVVVIAFTGIAEYPLPPASHNSKLKLGSRKNGKIKLWKTCTFLNEKQFLLLKALANLGSCSKSGQGQQEVAIVGLGQKQELALVVFGKNQERVYQEPE